MSKNLQILAVQSDIHNLQCLISLMKKMLTGPDPEILFNEYEIEGMIDQLDDAFDRLERLHSKLDTMKEDTTDFSTVNDAQKVVAILAKTRATHRKQKVSINSCNGNGNGIPNLRA